MLDWLVIEYKNKIKYLSLIFFVFLFCTQSSFASENVIPSTFRHNIAVTAATGISTTKNMLPKGAAQISPINEEKLAQKEAAASSANEAATKEKKLTFADLIFRMLKGLAGVLFLIALIVGIVWAYRVLISKYVRKVQPAKQEQHPSSAEHEPRNISEAVASFVKHRIRRK